MTPLQKPDKYYTHVFFSEESKRGVYTVGSDKTKYFEQSDPNFKNPAKLIALMGIDSQLFVTIVGLEMTVVDWYYISGNRFFTSEEITKFCTGMKWAYK